MTSSPVIVWLDPHVHDSTSSFRTKLTANHEQSVKLFSEVDPCVAFLRDHVNQRIFFILSGSFGSTVVPTVYDYEHVHQMYLFCGLISAHVGWAVDFVDKLLMFDHEDDLLQRLLKDIEIYLRQQADWCIQQAAAFKERAKQFDQDPCG